MDGRHPHKQHTTFNRFFFRGLGILLPSMVTLWLLAVAYQFVAANIAGPINEGVKLLWINTTPWPRVYESELAEYRQDVQANPDKRRAMNDAVKAGGDERDWLRHDLQRAKFITFWHSYKWGLDLIGLLVAVLLIYTAGALLGSFIGRRIYARGEELIDRVPLIRRVYPAVKQITDFFFGDKKDQLQFSRVVAVEYPRKGLWSVGLVTGSTMRYIQDRAGADCLTVFVPSSPTPFTGYVITTPKTDTIDLPISIEDALKFAVSGGVLVPPNQQILDVPRQPPAGPQQGPAVVK